MTAPTHRPRGRPKGSGNVNYTALRNLVLNDLEKKGLLAYDTIDQMSMIDIMEMAARIEAKARNWVAASNIAAIAAQYRHPKLALQAVNVTNTNDDRSRSDTDLQAELDELRQMEADADTSGAMVTPVSGGPKQLEHSRS